MIYKTSYLVEILGMVNRKLGKSRRSKSRPGKSGALLYCVSTHERIVGCPTAIIWGGHNLGHVDFNCLWWLF